MTLTYPPHAHASVLIDSGDELTRTPFVVLLAAF